MYLCYPPGVTPDELYDALLDGITVRLVDVSGSKAKIDVTAPLELPAKSSATALPGGGVYSLAMSSAPTSSLAHQDSYKTNARTSAPNQPVCPVTVRNTTQASFGLSRASIVKSFGASAAWSP